MTKAKTIFDLAIDYHTPFADSVYFTGVRADTAEQAIEHAKRRLRRLRPRARITIDNVRCEVSAWDDSRRASKRSYG
jgi:hypothetical protein